jgi:hypothetical protein
VIPKSSNKELIKPFNPLPHTLPAILFVSAAVVQKVLKIDKKQLNTISLVLYRQINWPSNFLIKSLTFYHQEFWQPSLAIE